jgi:hypothetical protein
MVPERSTEKGLVLLVVSSFTDGFATTISHLIYVPFVSTATVVDPLTVGYVHTNWLIIKSRYKDEQRVLVD